MRTTPEPTIATRGTVVAKQQELILADARGILRITREGTTDHDGTVAHHLVAGQQHAGLVVQVAIDAKVARGERGTIKGPRQRLGGLGLVRNRVLLVTRHVHARRLQPLCWRVAAGGKFVGHVDHQRAVHEQPHRLIHMPHIERQRCRRAIEHATGHRERRNLAFAHRHHACKHLAMTHPRHDLHAARDQLHAHLEARRILGLEGARHAHVADRKLRRSAPRVVGVPVAELPALAVELQSRGDGFAKGPVAPVTPCPLGAVGRGLQRGPGPRALHRLLHALQIGGLEVAAPHRLPHRALHHLGLALNAQRLGLGIEGAGEHVAIGQHQRLVRQPHQPLDVVLRITHRIGRVLEHRHIPATRREHVRDVLQREHAVAAHALRAQRTHLGIAGRILPREHGIEQRRARRWCRAALEQRTRIGVVGVARVLAAHAHMLTLQRWRHRSRWNDEAFQHEAAEHHRHHERHQQSLHGVDPVALVGVLHGLVHGSSSSTGTAISRLPSSSRTSASCTRILPSITVPGPSSVFTRVPFFGNFLASSA